MNLKLFKISFINLLVALTVCAANASPSKNENFLLKSLQEYKKGNYQSSDYLIAKYLGDVESNRLDAIKIIQKRQIKPSPTSFIDGEYSNNFLQFFFTRTLNQWGSQKNDKDDNILVKINSSNNQYVSVWGKPYIETWYILPKKKKRQIAYTVGMRTAKIKIGKIHESDRLLQPCDTFEINGPIQYFYEPVFQDINKNGKKELLLRYNVTVADGYVQVLDIFVPRVKNNYCHLSHKKSYYGRNGLAYFHDQKIKVSEQTPNKGESVLGSSLQTEKIYNSDNKLINKRVTNNFLRTEDIGFLDPFYEPVLKNDYNKYSAYLKICLKGKEEMINNCEELFDTRGPYKTEEECEERIFQMKADLPIYKTKFEPKGYLCKKLSDKS